MGTSAKKLSREMGIQSVSLRASMQHPSSITGEAPRATESGVFVTCARAIDLEADRPSLSALDKAAIEEVTLVVYEWENVQPGTLSWVFPSLRSALDAVRAMRNAVRWAVLLGDESGDVDAAREDGRVLVEAS